MIAAAELFLVRGYDAVTMDDVARRAGWSRRTLFNQFRSKAGLLAAIADSFSRHFVEAIPGLVRNPVADARDPAAVRAGKPRGTRTGLSRPTAQSEELVEAATEWCRSHRFVAVARVALAVQDLPWLAEATRSGRSRMELRLIEVLGRTTGKGPTVPWFYHALRARLAEAVDARPAHAAAPAFPALAREGPVALRVQDRVLHPWCNPPRAMILADRLPVVGNRRVRRNEP